MRCFDIHTHILPGVDDGSDSMDTTRELLKLQLKEGVTDIIATSHYDTRRNRQDYDHIMELTREVQEEAKKLDSELKIYSGAEILYSRGVLDDIKDGKVPMIAGTECCLVEFYPSQSFNEIEEALNNIIMLGKTPIIAHLERYQCFIGKIDLVRDVVKLGAYVQINSNSFLEGMFSKNARFIKKLLVNDLIHFVGSDCHDMVRRKPQMEKTYKYIAKVAGEDVAERITVTNPEKIVSGEYL